MTTEAFLFKKGLGVAQYIIVGDGLKFLPQISFYTGLRLVLEKNTIKYSFHQPVTTTKEDLKIHKAIDLVERFLCAAPGKWSGLFLYTSWYKDTLLIGCAKGQSDSYFFKIFKHESSARKEHAQMEKLSSLYGRWFQIPQVIECSKSFFVLSFVNRYARVKKQAACQLLATVADNWKKKPSKGSASLVSLLEKLKYLTDHLNYADLPKTKIDNLLEMIHGQLAPQWAEYPLYLTHGDMTSWNMYLTSSRQVALVDAERVGFRSIYTDLLHYHIQQKAMQRFEIGSAISFVHYLCRWTAIGPDEAKAYSILYLLEELCQDAQDLADFKEQQALVRAFARKLSWLKTIIKNSPS